MWIIAGAEDIWLEGGEEEEKFKWDLAEEIIAIEWWDPANPADYSISYKEERMTEPIKEDDQWYKDDINEENN